MRPQDPRWIAGPRVRVDSLKRGARVLTMVGDEETYERVDGALSGVHWMRSGATYAGSAEVVLMGGAS